MNIFFFETNKEEEEYFRKNLGRHKLSFYEHDINEKNVKNAKDADILVIFVDSQISKEILDKLPKLKFVATRSTGYDHIDLSACKEKGVKVSSVPHYGENTVAEHTFGLILSLSRKIPDAVERTKKDNFSLKGLEGFDLKGKVLGVIGPGDIGQHVIRMAKGFDMKVIANSNHNDKKLARKLGFSFVSLNYLLRNSDIITLHIPLNNSTRHLINMENVKMIKKGAYLVNTSRGEVVDTKALKYALDRCILAGAALDVLEGEEEIKEEKSLLKREFNGRDWETFLRNHVLLKDKNVIVTPHIAFYTKEALHRILNTTAENVEGFLKGKVRNRAA